jgi:tagatose-1,6-bisphosphate aldolase
MLSPGKIRGLTAASTEGGIFTILAIYHRDSMRAVLDPGNPAGLPAAALTATKLELLRALGAEATAVMLDPEYSAAQAIAARALPGSVGFLAAIEAQGYLGDPTARQTSLLDGWSVEKAKRLGASGIKLLVLYRPDSAIADAQDAMIAAVVADCARNDIPLFLEPLAYATDPDVPIGSAAFAARRRRIVVDTVRRLAENRPMDFLILLALYVDANRNMERYASEESAVIDRFLGDTVWRPSWETARGSGVSVVEFLAREYSARMASLGYLLMTLDEMVKVRTHDRRLPLYYLALFSRNERGLDFWRQVLRYSEDQLPLL